MSDTPKFTVVDRRKFRAEDETATDSATASSSSEAERPASSSSRLTLVEPTTHKTEAGLMAVANSGTVGKSEAGPVAVVEAPSLEENPDFEEGALGSDASESNGLEAELPPAPSAEETRFQKAAYDKAADRLEDLVRAQNPGAPPSEKIGFDHLVQQLYLSAMMQMGAGTPEGQRPRIDILGARQTIDLLQVVLDKTGKNLSDAEVRTLSTVLYELRMTFLELTRMITAPQPPPTPPPGAKAGAKR